MTVHGNLRGGQRPRIIISKKNETQIDPTRLLLIAVSFHFNELRPGPSGLVACLPIANCWSKLNCPDSPGVANLLETHDRSISSGLNLHSEVIEHATG